jgi:hypothetical protein
VNSPGDNCDLRPLECELDSFDVGIRMSALLALVACHQQAISRTLPLIYAVNLHYHTFFSYNAEGLSPSHIAWRARRAGLGVAGIVDFDVLDGMEEFLEAGRVLALRTCVGIETRVFFAEYADEVVNSPGEPGICYHVGMGLTGTDLDRTSDRFLADLRATAARRNRQLIERVNPHLAPVELDYEEDVLPLTPSGNATERHICLAYAQKAQSRFSEERSLAEFWSGKLGVDTTEIDLPEGSDLQQAIRAQLMKRGGPGYVQPDAGSFPTMKDMNHFIAEAGGIPTYAWLDGMSDGERDSGRLMDTVESQGAEALNIIPDRNYTPGKEDTRLTKLREIVAVAEEREMPVFVGTEMNSPGQKFADDFDSGELKPLMPAFMRGAHIAYGHTVLQRAAGLGYTSTWAQESLGGRAEKNEFYESVGRAVDPRAGLPLPNLDESTTPETILKILNQQAEA